jgi:hypothetical protein
MMAVGLIDRVLRAVRLEESLYEEVRDDDEVTSQAILVVVVASVAGGVGSALGLIIAGYPIGWFLGSFAFSAVFAVGGWFVWSYVTFWIGTNYFGGQANFPQVVRCAGFGMAPQTLSVVGFIAVLGGLISFVGVIWSLIAMVIGVRQALRISTGNAVVAGIISAVVVAVAIGVITAILSAMGLWWLYFGIGRPF